jgi:superoxide dismutase, Fe-Mn family
MAFTLPALPYPQDALEPVIDKETVSIHHGKHHQAYVNNLNAALEGHPDIAARPIEDIIAKLGSVPEAIRTPVRNHGGGHLNHMIYWESMAPNAAKAPSGPLDDAIKATFGSIENLKTQFNDAGLKRFGSGWAWLVKDAEGKLSVISTPNQDCPLTDGLTPILVNDVWEHAYYLKYQNRRADYLAAWWNIVNWAKAGERFGK